MRHGWIGVLALVVVPAACASALRGAASYTVTHLVGPDGSAVNVAQSISNGGIIGTSTINNVDYGVVWQGSQVSLLPGPSGYSGGPSGINASGEIVGSIAPAGSADFQPVVWQNGQMQTLSTPPGLGGDAYAVNDGGVVAGTIYNPTNQTYQAAIWNNGQMTLINNSLNAQSYAVAINNGGQVVVEVAPYSYIWSNSSLTAIPSLGGSAVVTRGMNNNGAVVGIISITGATVAPAAFVYKNGLTQLLPGLAGDTGTDARAVNDFDVIVGAGGGDDGSAHALVWESGQVVNLNDLIPAGSGWTLLSATGIDNDGDIVGYGTFDNQMQAFELTPSSSPSGSSSAPEPGTLAIFTLAVPLLLRRRRRNV